MEKGNCGKRFCADIISIKESDTVVTSSDKNKGKALLLSG